MYNKYIFIIFKCSINFFLKFKILGHFDKQPHFDGWREGLGPTNPVIKDGKLFGRGAVDDGYSIYTSVLAIKAAQLHGAKLPRCVIFIEGDEESEE